MKRIVVLGASNARRCLPTILSAARAASGAPVKMSAAIGHGRSYGSPSSVLGRSLPGILQSGIWQALKAANEPPSNAVLVDIGNDILYGFSVSEILGWVGECVSRLERLGAGIVVMGLPVATVDRLGPAAFLLFRTILFPSSRLSLGRVRTSVRELDRALRRLAEEKRLRFVEPRGEWYGFDPIHIRFRNARQVWSEILETDAPPHRLSPIDTIRIRLARAERSGFFGFEILRAQPALTLEDGTEIWLF